MRIALLRTPARMFILLAGLLATGMLLAQSMADPTRPPPAWINGQPQAPRGAELEQSAPGAQIVVLSSSRSFVVVNGQTVHVGEHYNGARLMAIRRDGVVWRRDGVNEKTVASTAVRKSIRGAEPMAGKAKPKKKNANGEVQ